MILALAIGLMLLTGLYLMMSTQLTQSQAGRESIEEATLARALLTRMANDVLGSLGAVDPKTLPDPAAEATTGVSTVSFNLGVQGSAEMLALTSSRVPREMLLPGLNPEGIRLCDLRRITYWLEKDKGLYWNEMLRVTSEEADLIAPDASNPDSKLIASEVKALGLKYWDPESDWVESWDGTTPGANGETPIGPPAAIEITLEMTGGTYRHVVTLPTGNNFSLQTTP